MIREQNSAGQHFENGPKSLRFVSQDFALLCCSLHTLLIEAAAGACEPEGRKGNSGYNRKIGQLGRWVELSAADRPPSVENSARQAQKDRAERTMGREQHVVIGSSLGKRRQGIPSQGSGTHADGNVGDFINRNAIPSLGRF